METSGDRRIAKNVVMLSPSIFVIMIVGLFDSFSSNIKELSLND